MKKWLTILSAMLFITFFANSIYAMNPDEKKLKNLNKGIFIVASEALNYSSLRQTVIYIFQHDEAGSSGIIINRPTNLTVNEAFPETHASELLNSTLHFGGPLHTQYLFMLTQTKFTQGLFEVNQGIYFGTGEALAMRLHAEKSPDKIKIFGGFMSWGPGQLEHDILDSQWIMTPASSDAIFSEDTDKLWQTLYNRWAGSWI